MSSTPKRQHQHPAPSFLNCPCRSHSIQAKGVPLPEVDEQLLPLQQQVSVQHSTDCRHHNNTRSGACLHQQPLSYPQTGSHMARSRLASAVSCNSAKPTAMLPLNPPHQLKPPHPALCRLRL
jgi:hypothetical protein